LLRELAQHVDLQYWPIPICPTSWFGHKLDLRFFSIKIKNKQPKRKPMGSKFIINQGTYNIEADRRINKFILINKNM
jgi:hypothetical protein